MKIKYDQEEVELTARFENALIELMKAECEMMALAEPHMKRCWTWGRCTVGDLAYVKGLSFVYGGDDDKQIDGLGDFGIIYSEEK